MVGPGQAIDTERFHVICVNSLGSCHGSTGPASPDPRTGRPYRLSFPVLTIEDIATAAHEAVKALGIPRLRAVVGPSLGGMTALAYAMLFPGDLEALVVISGAARATPFAIAIRSLQREAIRSDPGWLGGDYPPGAGPVTGHAPGAQAGPDHLSLRAGVARALRARAGRGARSRRGALRHRVRGRGLPGDARQQVRGHLRREQLSVPVAGDGPVRRGGARRLGGGRRWRASRRARRW